jgi:hypothetical protein
MSLESTPFELKPIKPKNRYFIENKYRNYHGFCIHPGMIYGTHEGILFAASGIIEGGRILVYANNGRGWFESLSLYNEGIAAVVFDRFKAMVMAKTKCARRYLPIVSDRHASELSSRLELSSKPRERTENAYDRSKISRTGGGDTAIIKSYWKSR